ncbi:MAG: DUF2179 domain-containing protein [Candidatus Eisenbacteria bacterium]
MVVDLYSSPWFQYLLLPVGIFLARVADVSIGTLRVIMLGRGMRILAPLLGFVEVMIWLLAIGQIMKNLNNWVTLVAYGAGFATGNYVGMVIESKLAIGVSMVRVIAPAGAVKLKRFLRRAGYRMTVVPGEGAFGPVEIIFTVIRRRQLNRVEEVIQRYNPKAFYTVEDVRFASEAVPFSTPRSGIFTRRRLIPRRKGK